MKSDYSTNIEVRYKNSVLSFETYSSFKYTEDDPVFQEVINLFKEKYFERHHERPETKDLKIWVFPDLNN